MSEDKKKKSGLHKNISSIFEGVPLPQPGSLQQPPPAPGGPAPEPAAGATPRPLPPPFQALHIPQAAQGYEAARRPSEGVSKGSAKAAGKTGGPSLWQQIKDKLLVPKPGVSGSRQKAMLVLVPLLFVVFIFVFFKWLNPAISPSQPVRKPQPVKVPKPVVAADTKIEWEIPTVYPKNLRDPGRLASSEPIVTTPEPKPEPKPEPVKVEKLMVKGILYGRNNPSAIIGTQIVHEGDKVSGMTIVKIDRNSVEFEKSGEKWKQGVEP
jgi:hypothetical protein